MQIAVSAADQPLLSAFDQKRTNPRESRAAAVVNVSTACDSNRSACSRKRRIVLFDVLGKRRDPRAGICDRSALVCGRDRTRQFLDQRFVDVARVGEKIEGLGFVEAAHFERPLNGRSPRPRA